MQTKTRTQHQKLCDFIELWVNASCNTDEKKDRFYVYLGSVIQSKLVHDLVNLKSNEYSGYKVVGDAPLLDIINDYDLDEVYNQWMKNNAN